MTKVTFYPVKRFALVICALVGLFSCNSDNSDSDSTTANINNVVAIVTSGTWKITYFYDSNKEETNNFSGYSFTFANSGVLTATNGTLTHTGTWSVTNDDDSKSDLDFNLAFSTPETFVDLTDDWDIIEKTNSTIKLKDVSGGDGSIDYLTFTKI